MSYLFVEKLQAVLRERTGLGYLNGNKKELICRCPFPGCELELGRHYRYGRCYIDIYNPVFYCFRCEETGTIFKLFQQLNLDPNDFIDMQHEVFKFQTAYRQFDSSTTSIKRPKGFEVRETSPDLYKDKIFYLKGRLGFDTNVYKIPNVILNVRDFIYDNKIELNEFDRQRLNIYDDQYIGIITNRSTLLILRNIHEDHYHKIQLRDGGDYKDFYGLATGAIKPQLNKVVLCEGVFDLLVAIRDSEFSDLVKESCFWACALGSGFNRLIGSVLDYLKLPCSDVIVLSDKDKNSSSKIYQKLYENPMVRHLDIYWNKFGHDWGRTPLYPVKTSFAPELKSWRKKRASRRSFR